MFDWKKPTAQMLGRWQPWHDGHTELFKRALKVTGQVCIMFRDVDGVNAGVEGQEDNPFDFENVKKDLIYIDTIYNPVETKTLKFLKRNNIKTFSGLDMLIYQGQKSFYLWNKINPEIDDELVNLLKSKL